MGIASLILAGFYICPIHGVSREVVYSIFQSDINQPDFIKSISERLTISDTNFIIFFTREYNIRYYFFSSVKSIK